MQAHGAALGHNDLLWLLGSLCSFHRLPFDATLIAHEFPPPYSMATLHEAGRALGLRTGKGRIDGVDWPTLPLPVIAFLKSLPHSAADQPAAPVPQAVAADRKSTRLNSSHIQKSRMPSSA